MPTADQALARLQAGNARFVSGQMTHPHQTPGRRNELIRSQQPFATVLTCSDSRVPPEILFDQGLGDIFVIRNAGNIADEIVLGSIEYAAAHLHTPLILVLGHAKCGAVAATASGAQLDGHLPAIAAAIQPAVVKAKTMPGDLVDNAVRENAKLVAKQIETSMPILAPLVAAGTLKVLPARYDFATGKVDVLPMTPGGTPWGPMPTGQPITKTEVLRVQQAWADGIVAIGQAYTNRGDYRAVAANHVDTLYAYNLGTVLFKPTKAAQNQFRLNREEALSYFVGGVVPEDKGFALQPWSAVRFVNAEILLHGNTATAMGNYFFTDVNTGTETKVEFTFGYVRGADGKLRINVHHSALPYNPVA